MSLTPQSRPKASASRLRERAPGGLVIPVRATLAGYVRWRVLDDRGHPEAPRNPAGTALASPDGVLQPNLITNLGLNQIALTDALETRTSVVGWRRRLAVGTGSTTPAVTDTVLDNEVKRDATSGTFSSGSETYALDGTNNVWRAEILVTRLVTADANWNLTEFGLANETTGSLHVRELLRDGVGDPATVSLIPGKSIRVDHTLVVEIPAPASGNAVSLDVEEYDVSDTLVSTTEYSVVHGGHVMSVTEDNVREVFRVWNPQQVGETGRRRLTGALTYGRTETYASTSSVFPFTNAAAPLVEMAAYVPDSHERVKRHTSEAGEMNTEWHGFAFTNRIGQLNNELNRSGWFVQFVSPGSYEKSDTDTLRVGLVSSWARA